MAKMTKIEQEEWDKLYKYVKEDILQYKDKKMPRQMILRLKGLLEGKFMANGKSKAKGKYTYEQILLTFKLNKIAILSAIKKNNFKNEQHMINYIMVIVENNINDVVNRIARVKRSEKSVDNIKTQFEKSKDDNVKLDNNYTKKTKQVKKDLFKDLW